MTLEKCNLNELYNFFAMMKGFLVEYMIKLKEIMVKKEGYLHGLHQWP